MTADSPSSTLKPLTPTQAILLGTLTVGVLDMLDAIVFYGIKGVSPIRIPQSIASGVLGRAAFAGGLSAAALGTLLHFFIAFVVVGTYYLASRRLPALTRYPLVFGPLYGLAVYGVMNGIVIPLSAAMPVPPSLPVVLNGVAIHLLGVGLPSALAARAAQSAEAMPLSRRTAA